MPTYDYQCRSCGTVIEVIHPMTEDGPSVCEICGKQIEKARLKALPYADLCIKDAQAQSRR